MAVGISALSCGRGIRPSLFPAWSRRDLLAGLGRVSCDRDIMYSRTTVLLLAAPLFGIPVGMESVVLLALFQIAFWCICGTAGKKQKYFRGGKERSISARCSVLVCMVLSVCLAVSFLGVSPNSERLFQSVYAAEGFVYRGLRQISGQADEPIVGGTVSGRNNYRTGTPQLEVLLSEQPSEVLYLKGFTGREYTGGDWEYADENELFAAMADLLDWQEWESWIGAMYSTMYFALNEESVRREDTEPVTMAISQANGELYALYYPYYCRWNRQIDLGPEWYGFDYFERADMDVDWDTVADTFGRAAGWYLAILRSYESVIQTAYTGVPEDLLPRLSRLCRENPLEGTEEVTAFITSVLENSASYTLTPGNAPLNEDIVEYFLFENHEGYCVHYASAATLIYRLYGIPARYAAGYMLLPDDFEQQEDGTWRAVVTDESAHAWTEIFLEDYGWTPVDVTPAEDGTVRAFYPGFDSDTLSSALGSLSLNMDTGNDDQEEQNAEIRTGQPVQGQGKQFGTEDLQNMFLLLGAAVLEGLCLLPLILSCRRIRRACRMEKAGCRQIFALLLEMMHYAGTLDGYTGGEPDFPEALAAVVPDIRRQEAEMLQEIVSRAAYSMNEPTAHETAVVREICIRAGECIYGSLGKWKKFLFKYVRAYV